MWRRQSKLGNVSAAIATLNSAAYISPLVAWLTSNFADVVVGVDSKTTDRTLEEVRRFPVRVIEVENSAANSGIYMLEAVSGACRSEWVLRLDDDELISASTLDYLRAELANVQTDVVAFHRKWCRVRDHRLEWMAYPPFGLDWQWRLYRRQSVRFYREIHTPGFAYDSWAFAPVEACFLHLDWIYHSYDFRKAKIAKYDAMRPGRGSAFREYYLYEDVPDMDSYFVPVWPASIPQEVRTSLLR